MEKFSQFRDRGSGVSPFYPIHTPTTLLSIPLSALLFTLRLPLLIAFSLITFLLTSLVPLPSLIKKALLWLLLAIPGIWWIDLRIDSVKPGSLSAPENKSRVPHPGTVIACTSTSPIDALYLAAIFDPIFTVATSGSRHVRYISLFGAIFRALAYPRETEEGSAQARAKAKAKTTGRTDGMATLAQLVRDHPKRIIVVFPECTATNGQGILPMSPCLLHAGDMTKIFPLSLRYSPADVTTPVPGGYAGFLWRLLGRSTHCIRVRIAEAVTVDDIVFDGASKKDRNKARYLQNALGDPDSGSGSGSGSPGSSSGSSSGTEEIQPSSSEISTPERKLLDRVADDLARLGRAKRVGLTVRDKMAFVQAWEGRVAKTKKQA